MGTGQEGKAMLGSITEL